MPPLPKNPKLIPLKKLEVSKENRTEYWAAHVAAAKAEGTSSSEYARRQGISVAALYYWQRKFKTEAAQKPSSNFIALRVASHPASQCTLRLPTGLQLELSALPTPEWLIACESILQGAR